MTLKHLAVFVSLAVILTACGTTDSPQNGVNRRAELERIQEQLNARLTSEDGSYGQYLILLKSRSEELKNLAVLPVEAASGDPELAARNLMVSVSAASLLADLPGADPAIQSAVRAGSFSQDRLDAVCAGRESADCALGRVLLMTLPTRQTASDALTLTVRIEDPSRMADLAVQTYSAFSGSLPDTIPAFSMADRDAGAVTHFAAMQQQACTLSWAHSLLLPKIDPARVMAVNTAFRSAMAGAFDHAKVNLCVAGADRCTAAELKCANGENSSARCDGRKTSALLNSCGPVEPDLAGAISSLTSDTQRGS